MNTKNLEAIARKLPPVVTRLGKRLAVPLRAREQLKACRRGFDEYGDCYNQPILFIAGLPKSGSTWIEKMVSSYPGYCEYLLPAIASHELATGGSHDFEMPAHMFDNMREMLVLTKMHSHGSKNNVRVLKDAGINYVVLHKDNDHAELLIKKYLPQFKKLPTKTKLEEMQKVFQKYSDDKIKYEEEIYKWENTRPDGLIRRIFKDGFSRKDIDSKINKIQNNINNLLILLDKMDRKINSKTHQKQLIEKITLEKNNLQKTYDHSLVEANDVENILEIFRMSSLSSR